MTDITGLNHPVTRLLVTSVSGAKNDLCNEIKSTTCVFYASLGCLCLVFVLCTPGVFVFGVRFMHPWGVCVWCVFYASLGPAWQFINIVKMFVNC